MSERREAQAKEDAFASGAKPRLEERIREQGWRPTRGAAGFFEDSMSAARPRAIDSGRLSEATLPLNSAEAAMSEAGEQ